LGLALFVALGFEFVNGFHDTANAVATVIYTHTLDPHIAVAWSGFFNFLGVVSSTGIVAFGIISLLPVELILQVGSNAGFAMVFALLVAAILWNLGTWYFGLPASSSLTLIGSIIGVGITNQLMSVRSGTSGVDWGQAANVGKLLLISPIVGFICAGLLLLVTKVLVKDKKLYRAPEGSAPPPFWIRGLLMLTCTGVSFFHGSNDGQKGMGLIMLILIGTVPTTYALNHAITPTQTQHFIAVAIALGLGTMVGWKRIVVTVGEKIGKNHLTYAQGAAAEITAMATSGAADYFGLPVSTTHVLSSGVAGTMAANHSGLQWGTVRNLLMAWVLTLPVAMTLSGFLFWTFRKLF
jgi:phosphate/sulfate permease